MKSIHNLGYIIVADFYPATAPRSLSYLLEDLDFCNFSTSSSRK